MNASNIIKHEFEWKKYDYYNPCECCGCWDPSENEYKWELELENVDYMLHIGYEDDDYQCFVSLNKDKQYCFASYGNNTDFKVIKSSIFSEIWKSIPLGTQTKILNQQNRLINGFLIIN